MRCNWKTNGVMCEKITKGNNRKCDFHYRCYTRTMLNYCISYSEIARDFCPNPTRGGANYCEVCNRRHVVDNHIRRSRSRSPRSRRSRHRSRSPSRFRPESQDRVHRMEKRIKELEKESRQQKDRITLMENQIHFEIQKRVMEDARNNATAYFMQMHHQMQHPVQNQVQNQVQSQVQDRPPISKGPYCPTAAFIPLEG